MIKDVLVINSYGGSLLLATRDAGLDIRGSYEDTGYGIDAQRANFKGLDWREKRSDWPARQDLRRSIVIAHPPCSAFSNMTPGLAHHARGVNSEAFQCTVQVLDYATENRAAAVLVESVVPAMQGAWHIHERYTGKYHLYRILQNASAFGVPQNRNRFWVAYIRKDLAPRVWNLRYKPRSAVVADILDKNPGPSFPYVLADWERQKAKMFENGITEKMLQKVLNDVESYGTLPNLLKKLFFPELKKEEVHKKYLPGRFVVTLLRRLDPQACSPVILGDSLWMYRDRFLSQAEYKAIMGFPKDYIFPKLGKGLWYLSKGIVPPVGTWLLQETVNQLGPRKKGNTAIVPNVVSDLREIGKDD